MIFTPTFLPFAVCVYVQISMGHDLEDALEFKAINSPLAHAKIDIPCITTERHEDLWCHSKNGNTHPRFHIRLSPDRRNYAQKCIECTYTHFQGSLP